jgi:predicted Rossmann fold nucleotide-binding protein DprA/Smf involved in DNA uptake
MSFEVTVLTSRNPNYPSFLQEREALGRFPQIWAIGNLALLERPLLGLFCSVKCPGDLILHTYDLARALRDSAVPIVGGFHSPLEKDCFDLLLRGSQPLVICHARNIENMMIRKSSRAALEGGRLLYLSTFGLKIKRQTAETAKLRNKLVSLLAKLCFVIYAEPGGMVEQMCREIILQGRIPFTFNSRYNDNLLALGAKAVDPNHLSQWVASVAGTFPGSGERRRS